MRTKGTVDDWFGEQEVWRDETALLRQIVQGTGLDEVLKWGQPAYGDQGTTILLVSHLKAHATVSFLQGALLDDPQGRLVTPGQHSRHARYLPFTSVQEVAASQAMLEDFIRQAVANARAGKRVPPLAGEMVVVDELQEALDADEAFRAAFEALTPGRRRGYNLHIGQAKQASTRVARIAACTPRILAGIGLQECICGRSKRMPRCDGTHKHPEA